MTKLTVQELETILCPCANVSWWELSVSEYKDYVFGILYLKNIK
ncbi:MAG: hypothetical protein ACP5PP_04165 [Fervidobacterium sp.]|jgi:hypothetical protein